MKTLFLILISISAHAQSKTEIVRQITTSAQVAGIDPDLAVAIAITESSLNPKAIGDLGEIDCFQLRPEYHAVIRGNTGHNTLVAVAYLARLKQQYAKRYGNAWFVLFNTGPNRPPKRPKDTKYYQRVMHEVSQLKFKRFLAVR